MLIDVLTIFPDSFAPVLNESILKRAQKSGKAKIRVNDIRDFSVDKHRKVDDRPFGGGPGMVMSAQPIFSAVEAIKRNTRYTRRNTRIILLSPQGKTLTQKLAKRLSAFKHLVFICGHYEGVDERVRQYLADEEVSIGDYVLTGGELPAMVLIDCIVRLLPGVLGRSESLEEESFQGGLLEYPHYTRPAVFKGKKVPQVLTSGDHKLIKKWREDKALELTRERRVDLLKASNKQRSEK